MRSISMWLTILLLMFVVCLLPATAKSRRGFSAGTTLSLTCNKIAYPYKGDTRSVGLTVSVSGETNNKLGRITLTGDGVPAPGYVDLPPYSKNITVTLPAAPGPYTYNASGKRYDAI